MSNTVMENLSFWAQTLRDVPVPERLEAVEAGGFASMSTMPGDCPDADACRRVRDAFEAAGVRLRAHDPFARWLPRWEPPAGMDAGLARILGTEETEFFGAVEILRPQAVTVVEPFGIRYELDELVTSFAAVCDRAAEIGVQAQIEFAPFTGIPDLALAWDIVRNADRPNGGIVFDTYHYIRGNPDDDLLSQIPGDRIFTIHVNDGPKEAPPSLVEENLHYRLLPGEGEWDLPHLLAILLGKEGIGDFGVEAISDDLAGRPPREVGERSGDALRDVLRAAQRRLQTTG
jgi:sugar phosphate isomerase/epimerase